MAAGSFVLNVGLRLVWIVGAVRSALVFGRGQTVASYLACSRRLFFAWLDPIFRKIAA